jgi:hypothetical protein
MATDKIIVRAVIHPAIGMARVGNSKEPDGYFVGPEVVDEPALGEGKYKDKHGALKRQAARFHIYGLNAAGEVVAELTADNADIEWTVHLANKKAAWYQFQLALDIPEASAPTTPPSARRNPAVVGADRNKLVIDPGPRSIKGRKTEGATYHFDSGKFFHLPVPLGELRTDDKGCLLVFGGLGLAQSLSGAPPETFANNDGWHDDVSDGPVDAAVTIGGKAILVEGAWVAVGPPNYAPALKTTRTLYDLLSDLMIKWGYLSASATVSFQRHIRPIFERLSGLQWVNQGFASWFGSGAPFNFDELLPRLADKSAGNSEFRARVYRQFRNPQPGRRQLGDSLWPQFYGDALDSLGPASPQNPDPSTAVPNSLAALSEQQLEWLRLWSRGRFDSDVAKPPVTKLSDVPLPDQPAALDEAALAYCLADAFHPGCELTWTMRISYLYSGPFRIKRRAAGAPEVDYGPVLSPAVAVSLGGPLDGLAAGDLTKWMAVPWQTDTASCLSGYTFFNTSPSLPTFWPARVPNNVLRELDFKDVMDTSKSEAVRLEAFYRRSDWFRGFPGDGLKDIEQMINEFHKLGVIEERAGPKDLPGVPSRLWVESKPDLPEPGAAPVTPPAPTPPAPVSLMATSFAGRKLRQFGRYGQTSE